MEHDLELIEKFRNFLLSMEQKTEQKLKKIEIENKIKEELRQNFKNFSNNEEEKYNFILSLGPEKLIEYYQIITNDKSINLKQLNVHLYMYERAKKSEALRKNERYKDAISCLDTIKNKMISFLHSYLKKNEEDELAKELTDIRKVLSSVKETSIEGLFDNLSSYNFIFDYAGSYFSETEKLELYKLFVKSNITYLMKHEEQRKKEINDYLQEELDKKALSVIDELKEDLLGKTSDIEIVSPKNNVPEEVKEERTVTEEPEKKVEKQSVEPEKISPVNEEKTEKEVVTTEPEKLVKITLDEETIARINRIKEQLTSQKNTLPNINEERKTTFNNLLLSYNGTSLINNDIKKSLNIDDYKLFLIYAITKKLEEIYRQLELEHNEDEVEIANLIIFDDLIEIEEYIYILNNVVTNEKQDKNIEESLENGISRTLIFYENKNETTEIDKNIKSYSKEKLEELIYIIKKLENDPIQNNSIFKKGSVRLNVIREKEIFVTFKSLPNNNILVYHTGSIDEFNKNITDNKFLSFNQKYYNRVKKIVIDNNIEYRELLSRNKTYLENLKQKVHGKGTI